MGAAPHHLGPPVDADDQIPRGFTQDPLGGEGAVRAELVDVAQRDEDLVGAARAEGRERGAQFAQLVVRRGVRRVAVLGDPQRPVSEEARSALGLGSEVRAPQVHVPDVEASAGRDGATQERQAAGQVGHAAGGDAEAAPAACMDCAERPAVGLGASGVHVALVRLVPELPRVHAVACVLHDGHHVARVLVRIGGGALPGRLGRGACRAVGHPGRSATEDAEDSDAVPASERDDLVEFREVVAIAGGRGVNDAVHLDVQPHDLRPRRLCRLHQASTVRVRRATRVDHRVRLDASRSCRVRARGRRRLPAAPAPPPRQGRGRRGSGALRMEGPLLRQQVLGEPVDRRYPTRSEIECCAGPSSWLPPKRAVALSLPAGPRGLRVWNGVLGLRLCNMPRMLAGAAWTNLGRK